jgi:hypothetical protein
MNRALMILSHKPLSDFTITCNKDSGIPHFLKSLKSSYVTKPDKMLKVNFSNLIESH